MPAGVGVALDIDGWVRRIDLLVPLRRGDLSFGRDLRGGGRLRVRQDGLERVRHVHPAVPIELIGPAARGEALKKAGRPIRRWAVGVTSVRRGASAPPGTVPAGAR